MTPDRMPTNGFSIIAKARSLPLSSATAGISVFTVSTFSSVVIVSQATNAARVPVPSLFSDMPMPTPTANSHAK